jgi:hypothetical protein
MHMEKKVARVFHRISSAPGLSEHEKHLFARTLAASPDQRWQMLRNYLQSLGLLTRSQQKKSGLLWWE